MTYSPEESDDWPVWKTRAFNVLVFGVWLFSLAIVAAAFWEVWTHLWLVPIIAAPLLAWWLIVSIKHP